MRVDEKEILSIGTEKNYGQYRVKRKRNTFTVYYKGVIVLWDAEAYEVENYLNERGF